jgi:hypothetical protein
MTDKSRSGKLSGQTGSNRHDVFVVKNAQWDRRVKSAISDLDKAAGKVKKSVVNRRRGAA